MTARDDLRLRGLKEIAEVMGTDWRNVRRLVERGHLPTVPVGDTEEPKLSLAMLEAWMQALGAAGLGAQSGAQSRAPRTPRATPRTPLREVS